VHDSVEMLVIKHNAAAAAAAAPKSGCFFLSIAASDLSAQTTHRLHTLYTVTVLTYPDFANAKLIRGAFLFRVNSIKYATNLFVYLFKFISCSQ